MSKKFGIHARNLLSNLVISSLIGATAAHAAAPVQSEQAPGFYRQQVGDAVVTAVYDGYLDLDPKDLSGMTQQQIQVHIAKLFQAKNSTVQTAVNAYLVHTKDNLILIDSGSSDCFGPTVGRLVDNIKLAGYDPADVDTVLLTHLHPDHACGITTPGGKPAFPNATIWADRKDADFWLKQSSASKLPASQHVFLKMAQAAVAPYAAQGRFKTFTGSDTIVPGVTVVPSNGHTPGHSSYLVDSGAEKLLVWGDIVHFHAVQLPHPEVTIEVDVASEEAVASRRKILAEATQQKWLVAAAHHPFPGLGHVRKEAIGYSWVPVEYAPLKTAAKVK